MSITLKRLPIGYFIKNYQCPPDTDDSFKIFALFENNKNTTFDDISNLSVSDIAAARTSFIKFHKNAVTGRPFKEIFDGAQFHTGHAFKYRDQTETVRRLRLVGDVRIYIYFLPNRNIVVLKTLAKRENSLSEGEKSFLEDITKKVINCSNAKLVIVS